MVKAVRKLPIVVGTMFEWFDLTVYAFVAAAISTQFFPPQNENAAFLSTAAAFGVAFLMRPIGAIAFGVVGDRIGRKPALTLSFGLMALATAMIAFAPTFTQIGLLATAILVVGRLLQGFAASGEVGASLAILLESTDQHRQATATGWLNLGVYSALTLASLVSLAVYGLLTPENVQAWGWRIPFIFGLLVAPIGLYVRWYMGESSEFLAAKRQMCQRSPSPTSSRSLGGSASSVLKLIALGGFGSPVVYLILIFMPTYATRELGLAPTVPRLSTFIASIVLVVLLVPMGHLCDKFGSRRVVCLSCALGTALVVPLMLTLVASPSLQTLLLIQCTLSVCLAAYLTGCGPLAIGLFPVAQRALGIGLGYNLGVVVFGAFAPFITAWLASVLNDKMVIAWYVMAGGVISLMVVLSLPVSKSLQRRPIGATEGG